MTQSASINIPTPIGSITLTTDEVFSFVPDERGGVIITLKEMIGNSRPEIISGYSYKAFDDWFRANKE
jgi:hypothetical protein